MKASFTFLVALANAVYVLASWSAIQRTGVVKGYSKVFQQKPPDPPPYMVDNTDNLSGQAPNKGKYNGPVWPYSGSFEGYMKRLHKGEINGVPTYPNATATLRNTTLQGRQAGGYWLPSLAPLGKQPLAGSDYVFYRDVTEYGASNKGDVDVSEAINAAIQDGDRCGMECGNTFHLGAIIYFPAGTYKICTPIIQLYYTQFIGDPHNRPIIKGCDNFTGIALMDTDPYIPNEAMPDGTGVNWYINQNQFFRQIRNFVFDLTEMPLETNENGQALVPTGIHWQVSQACSLQNLLFKMPEATTDDSITHVGIFTENGSGGFVSDLEFQGGAIGWRVGSQQYTARGLKFTNCITSIQMVWDWGFNWQDIEVNGGSIALNISGKGGVTGQGIGSISLIDSSINNVPVGILTRESPTDAPNIVIDNTVFNGVNAPVQIENGGTLLSGSQKVDLWATGRRYTGGDGTFQTGHVVGRPTKPAALLGSDGKLFTRSRPQYEDLGVGSFLIATENGCSNDGTGDNTNAINSFLQKAVAAGQIAYFPAGIYSVQGTVNVPVNSRILGASWSQIQATGSYFSDMKNPQVVVKVGDEGDVGTLEITDMIFSVKGPTAGAIMVEWNVKESSHGAAGMWDTHIRVGGALGSDLDHANCPKFGFSEDCITASLLLHVTPKSSGYFENVWAWVADHDNDMSLYWEFDKLASQISIYSGRGMLIESEGPCWFYGTGSEHTILYQYQLYNAKNIYMGHIQTETPYFQPEPVAPTPFEDSVALERFKGDPSFADCKTDACREAWGLRIIDSEDVVIHSAGMYSWFVNYEQECLEPENCQERIMQIRGSSRVAVFNVFTKGVTEVSTGTSNSSTIWQSDNKQGYTTEISVYLPEDGSDNIVYLGPEVYTSQTAQCEAPCTFVLPPSSLASNTTILIPPYTTSLEVGSSVGTTFVVTTTTITVTITPITTDKLPQSNVVATEGQSGAFNPSPSVLIPHSTVRVTKDDGETTERVITFPPWPQITNGPPDTWESQTGPWGPGGSGIPPLQPVGNPVPVTTQITGPTTVVFAWPAPPPTVVTCPPTTVPFESPATTITLPDCSGPATVSWACPPETTITVVGSSTGTFSAQCTPVTVIDIGPAPTEPITWEDPPYTKPPVVLRCPPETRYIREVDAIITLSDCSGDTTLFWDCPATKTVAIEAPTDKSFSLGCMLFTGTGEPLPTYTTWPPGELVWEEDEEGDDDDNKTTCKLWFFWICISWGEIKIGGWRWNFPTGVFPPGPPPTIRWPSGVTITGTLPGPWPPITIGSDNKVTYPSEQPEQCTTQTADICATTTTLSITTSGSQTITSTHTESTCTTIIGCEVEDDDTTATETTSCTGGPTVTLGRRDVVAEASPTAAVHARADCPTVEVDNSIIYPMDPYDVENLVDYLKLTKINPSDENSLYWWSKTKQVQGGSFTAFFFVEGLTSTVLQDILRRKEFLKVADAYGIYAWNTANYVGRPRGTPPRPNRKPFWELSLMSVPPGGQWSDFWEPQNNPTTFTYEADDTYGRGQTIYMVEDGINADHPEFASSYTPPGGGRVERKRIRYLNTITFPEQNTGPANIEHGTEVTSQAYGILLGLAKNAELVVVNNFNRDPVDPFNYIHERYLASLVEVLDDVLSNWPGNRGKVIINMSFGWLNDEIMPYMHSAHFDILYRLLKELDNLGAVLVAASHNNYPYVAIKDRLDGWPSRFGDPNAAEGESIKNLIVVSGINQNSQVSMLNPYASWLALAPGYRVSVADASGGFNVDDGASLAAPLVAGTIAYWRGLKIPEASGWAAELQDPANVKKLVHYMHRKLEYPSFRIENEGELPTRIGPRRSRYPFLWTGRVKGGDCLVDPTLEGCPPDMAGKKIADMQPRGADCAAGSARRSSKRQDGDSCPLVLNPGSGDSSGEGGSITYARGTPSPTCVSGCGTTCSGYYCVPQPTGMPPDYWDPEDPAHQITTPPPTSTQSLPPISSCSSRTTTTICNGSGGQVACITSTVCAPESTCASYTPTTICNGSGGQVACITSSACATPTDEPYSGPGCATYTSTTMCNGNGGQSACITGEICLPTRAPCPAWPTVGTPLCPSDFPICIRPTTAVLCARLPRQTAAPALAAVEARATALPMQADTPRAVPSGRFFQRWQQQRQQEKDEEQKERKKPRILEPMQDSDRQLTRSRDIAPVLIAAAAAVEDGVSIDNNTINAAAAHSAILGVRQEVPWGCGGHDTGGCTVYNMCETGFCARLEKVSCVQAYVHIKMHPIDTEMELAIYEDGEKVCERNIKCLTVQSPGCLVDLAEDGEFDCGGGNKIASWGNGLSTVDYVSSKTDGRHYMLYLGQEGGDNYYPCAVTIRFWALCVDSDWAASEGLCRTSSLSSASSSKLLDRRRSLGSWPLQLPEGATMNATAPAS